MTAHTAARSIAGCMGARALVLTPTQVARRVGAHTKRELYDDSGLPPVGIALYSLADPRDLQLIRYIGQTSLPRRRFLQHLRTARLWMTDERPWWIRQPKLRPLYAWMRGVYFAEDRLPTMVIHAWVDTPQAARVAERARIYELLHKQMPLLNVESEILGAQMPLI